MIRGTTTALTFMLDIPVDSLDKLWISFFQNDQEVMTKEKDDVFTSPSDPNDNWPDGKIVMLLTQEDTLKFEADVPVLVQMRARTEDGSAYASNIMKLKVSKVLKDGVI